MELHKAGALTKVSLSSLSRFTASSCKPLIDEIGDVVQIKNYSSSCKVESISHYFALKTEIINTTSKIKITSKQQPGDYIEASSNLSELYQYKYAELKKNATLTRGKYTGILHGSVKTHLCETMVDCPSCKGTGICSSCDGERKVACPVCDGNKECISCDGTGRYTCEQCEGSGECVSCDGSGRYTCRHCDGSGSCPECYDGWVTCGECGGDGECTCPDCCGTGNYIEDRCRYCGGSGTMYNGRECPKCGGSGTFILECRECDGSGTIDCSNCDGEGGWDCDDCGGSGICSHCHGEGSFVCRDCKGSGKCSHCHGEGSFTCKACNGTGTCGKCRGHGKIWCPDCNGTGVCFDCKGEKKVTCPKCLGKGKYQTYLYYSFTEKNETKHHLNFPLEQDDIVQTTGLEIFNGVIYDFFAKRCNVFDVESAKLSLHDFPLLDIEQFEEWVRLENNSEFTNDKITDDYLNIRVINHRIPITKILLTCTGKNYTIYVVGNERMIYFDELPGKMRLFLGRLFP